MKRNALATLLALAPVVSLFGQTEEELRLRDVAGRAFDQAAAANEAAQLLQIKVDQQADRIAVLEQQIADLTHATNAAAEVQAAAAAAADKAARQKLADEQWAAGAPERARQAAALQAAVDKWRASIKHTPNIIVTANQATGGASVIIDGKTTEFRSLAEANAFAAAVKQKALAMDAPAATPKP